MSCSRLAITHCCTYIAGTKLSENNIIVAEEARLQAVEEEKKKKQQEKLEAAERKKLENEVWDFTGLIYHI